MSDKCQCDMRIRLVGDGCRYCNPQKYIEILEAQTRDDQDRLEQLENWCQAYPRSVFIEPTDEQWAQAHEVLKAAEGCPSLDAISGSNMRHVVEGIQKLINDH